jgi:ParB family chromosome partitioning protein
MKTRSLQIQPPPLNQLNPEVHEQQSSTSGDVNSTPMPALPYKNELIDIAVTQLRVSPFNARKIRPQERIEKVAESLKENGQKDPIYVYPGVGDDVGFYMVLGGETRRRAALELGLSTLRAFVDRNVDPNDALGLIKISHILNDSLVECDLDRGMMSTRLSAAGHTYEEIAGALDIGSRQHVLRLIKLASLPKSFIDFGQKYPERFSASLGDLIHQAIEKHDEDFALELLQGALNDKLTHKKIENAIKKGPSAIKEIGNSKQRRRIRRIGGVEIKAPDAQGNGRYDTYDALIPGHKILKLQVEITDSQFKKFDKWIFNIIDKFVAGKEDEE